MPRLELTIERLSKSGDGVASHQGRAVFVAGVVAGERVLADVEEAGKVLRGELVQVLTPSPQRREPACPLAGRCGGCTWLHLSETEQGREKAAIVRAALEHQGGLDVSAVELRPLVQGGVGLGGRRRAVLHPVSGRLGFFGRRSHERVPVARCPALVPRLAELPTVLADALGNGLKDVDEVRLLEAEGRVAVSLHLSGKAKPKHREVLEALVRGRTVEGAVLVHGEGGPGPELFGEPALRDGGTWVRPDGFAQASVEVNRALVAEAVAQLAPTPASAVLELYAGNGNFTFPLAAQAKSVVAVESFPVSVQLAQRAALERKAVNVRFLQNDAEKAAESLAKEGARFDRLLLDPPRTGAPGVERWAERLGVARVVYVACDPVSLARDAKALVAAGYVPEVVATFDLFPQTHHVEAVMAFSRSPSSP